MLSGASTLEAGEACCWRFRRPTTGSGHAVVPSEHVYLSNVAGVSEEALLAAVTARGTAPLRLTRASPPRGGAGGVYEAVVLSYESVAAAAAAQLALDGSSALSAASSRALVARFSSLEPLEAHPQVEPPAPGPPAHSCASALGVPGVTLLLDFLTHDQEAALLAHVDRPKAPWEHLARRRVLHEGYRFDYHTRAADAAHPLPPFAPPVAEAAARIVALPACACLDGAFDQLTVNDYAQGAGIASHVDTHSAFAPVLASLSLAGSCVLELRRGEERRGLFLPRRSLLLLAQEARYGWAHYIPSRASDVVLTGPSEQGGPQPGIRVHHRGPRRVSLTFRRLTPPGSRCCCAWPEECDTARQSISGGDAASAPPLPTVCAPDGSSAGGCGGVPALELQNVWALYECIAPHFSATRVALWPAVRAFLDALPPRSLLLDLGSGNGKYLAPAGAQGHVALGCDVAQALLRECAGRVGGAGPGHAGQLFRADGASSAQRLPLRRGAFDGALCVAVMHHLSSPERRRACLLALASALRVGGTAVVTAWALEQAEPERTTRRWRALEGRHVEAMEGAEEQPQAQQEYFVPWHVPLHRPEGAAAARRAAGPDAHAAAASSPVVDAVKGTVVYQRYVHLFAEGELPAIARSVPGLVVEQQFFDASNWVVMLRKTA